MGVHVNDTRRPAQVAADPSNEARTTHGQRVGKHAAGRLLDSHTHDQFPDRSHANDRPAVDARSHAEGISR
jgi:hypothetical protein